MTKDSIWVASVLGLSILAAGAVVAGDGVRFGHCGMDRHAMHMPGARGDMGARVMHLLDRIDLTTEQRRQLLDILDAQQDVAQKARRSLIENRAALREAVMADSWDEAKVRELASSQAKETADRIVARGRDHASGSRAAE